MVASIFIIIINILMKIKILIKIIKIIKIIIMVGSRFKVEDSMIIIGNFELIIIVVVITLNVIIKKLIIMGA
jgi:hypothetical protein